jgi:predicted ATP-dependent serine protease
VITSRHHVSGTLVGRDDEISALDDALDRLRSGRPWMVQVVGEPGIGKSRLLLELVRRAEARGHLVLEGRGRAERLRRGAPAVAAARAR